MSTPATLIVSGGTVELTGRMADIAAWIAARHAEVTRVPFGALEFHFAPTRLTVRLISTHEQKIA